MDITQALKDTENALRDFIASVLRKTFGEEWIKHCGVSQDRIDIWRERKRTEKKKHKAGVADERLIYYADFYDLKTILKKHWSGDFSKALGDWKTIEVWLSELEKLRDPDAHRRELLPHQKNLALGIAGEIRTRLVRFRSKQETSEDYFPRIESARDSLGTIWVPAEGIIDVIDTELILRPNDAVDFLITASDPLGAELEYGIDMRSVPTAWQKDNNFSIVISDGDIGDYFIVNLYIRSLRKYHARRSYDDCVSFRYRVLPSKS
jgi:hypothetical protein